MNQSWVFALETSVVRAHLILAHGDQVIARETFTSERSQEVDLFEPLEQILSHLPVEEVISTVVVGTGPGSYNGARVGIAVAQALAQRYDCDVVGLCSFEGVAELSEGGYAVGDARRGSFFYVPSHQGKVSQEAKLLGKDEFEAWMRTHHEKMVTFEPVERLSLPQDLAQRVLEVTSDAEMLCQRWLERSEGERASLVKKGVEAFYLRPPHITKARKIQPSLE